MKDPSSKAGDWKLLSLEISISRRKLFFTPSGQQQLTSPGREGENDKPGGSGETVGVATLCSLQFPLLMSETVWQAQTLGRAATLPHPSTSDFYLKGGKGLG